MTDHPSFSQHRSNQPHRLPNFDYASEDVAYFVTIRARQDTSPFTDSSLATEVLTSLEWLRTNRGVKLYAFCLMPDHLHLLLQLTRQPSREREAPARPRPMAIADPSSALGTVLGSFKSYTTNRSWKLGYRGALWQPRVYDHILRRSEDGQRIVEYILENPVRKGLVERWEEYPYGGCPDEM